MMTRIIPIVLILLAIGLFITYINPTYTGEVATAKQQIQSYDSALAAAKAFTQKENQLTAQKNAIPPDQMARLTEYLPDGVDNVQLILDLNSLAARSGVALFGFKVQDNGTSTPSNGSAAPATTGNAIPLPSSNPVSSLDLSVSATGTYSAFRSFLAAAEQSLRPLDVTELDVKDSATGVYTYTATFRIYWLQ